MIMRIIDRLKPLLPIPLLVVDNCETFSHLPVNCVCDKYTNAGLPGAILTALESCNTDWCFIAGSDMPFVSKEIATALIKYIDSTENSKASKPEPDVIIPFRGFYKEPLFALYRKIGCTKSLLDMVEKNVYKVANLYEKVQVLYVDVNKIIHKMNLHDPFTNLNTYDDYERALEIQKFP